MMEDYPLYLNQQRNYYFGSRASWHNEWGRIEKKMTQVVPVYFLNPGFVKISRENHRKNRVLCPLERTGR